MTYNVFGETLNLAQPQLNKHLQFTVSRICDKFHVVYFKIISVP